MSTFLFVVGNVMNMDISFEIVLSISPNVQLRKNKARKRGFYPSSRMKEAKYLKARTWTREETLQLTTLLKSSTNYQTPRRWKIHIKNHTKKD
jgi:hypothetical protein